MITSLALNDTCGSTRRMKVDDEPSTTTMMPHRSACRRVAPMFAFALAIVAPVAWPAVRTSAESGVVAPPGGQILELSEFYTSSVGHFGRFPGELVCLPSEKAFVSSAAEDCKEPGRVFALKVRPDSATRPLVAASERTEQQMHQLVGRRVIVDGRYHSSTGVLIASTVTAGDDAPSSGD